MLCKRGSVALKKVPCPWNEVFERLNDLQVEMCQQERPKLSLETRMVFVEFGTRRITTNSISKNLHVCQITQGAENIVWNIAQRVVLQGTEGGK